MPLPRKHQHRHKPGQGDTLGATWHTGITTWGNFNASLGGTQWSSPAGVTRNFSHPRPETYEKVKQEGEKDWYQLHSLIGQAWKSLKIAE